MNKLAVIIVTNSEIEKLAQCVNTLYMSNYSYKDNYELIVIDNGSEHGSKIQEICKNVNCRYIRNDENISFSYANDIGIKASNSEWILLLNDDTIPHQQNTLERMIKFAEDKPKLGVQGVKLLFTGTELIQHCGVVFTQDRQPIHHLLQENLFDPRTMYAKQFQAVTGACLLIKRSVYNEVGGFSHISKQWGYHYEDIDLCLKAKQLGYEVWYNPDVIVYHYSASTFGKKQLPQGEAFKFLPQFVEKWFDVIDNDDYKHTALPEHNPIVMIGVPLSDGSQWIFPRLMNMIEGFHFNKKNIIISLSMTNCGKQFIDEIMNYARLNGHKYLDFLVTTKVPHFEDKMKSIYYNREQIRNMAIEKNVDYIFFIDSDVSMERTTLKTLYDLCEANKCEIAAGAYFYKIDDLPKPMLFKPTLESRDFFKMGEKDKTEISSFIEEKTMGLGNFRLAKDFMDGELHYAGATNMGCTLISKKCFDIPFVAQTHYGTEDLSWFSKAQEKGYRLLVDTSLKLFHLDPNGYVYSFWTHPIEDDEFRYSLKPVKEKKA